TNFFLILFWISSGIILYTYIVYFLVAVVLARFSSRRSPEVGRTDDWPEVTLVIAAYNEERFIAEKLRNSLELDYPTGKLKILAVTDGSSDDTGRIIQEGFKEVLHFHEPERRGKIHAVDRIMKHVTSPVVSFTDANTPLNASALKNIVRHCHDQTVGGVGG